MGRTVNSMSEELCNKTMSMVWPREFLGEKETLFQVETYDNYVWEGGDNGL